MGMGKPKKHTYELPCKNCKGMVKLTPARWLELWEKKRLPLCRLNGCNRYGKYLSFSEIENDFYSRQTAIKLARLTEL